MLDEVPQPGAPPKIRGSVMLAVAESKEAVLEKLKEDVYVKVWSYGSLTASAFRCSLLQPFHSPYHSTWLNG